MNESNQILTFGKGLVDAAKSLKIDPGQFINLETSNTVIRYKRMAPIIIANRLKLILASCKDEEERNKLSGYISELETAQNYGIDEGKSELIHWSSFQPENTVRACLGVYSLYSSKNKPVCDFVMIDIVQKRTVDMNNMALKYGFIATVASIFVPIIGPAIAAGVMLHTLSNAREQAKHMTTKENADVLMLKTLEHYGLIRLLNNDPIQLVND